MSYLPENVSWFRLPEFVKNLITRVVTLEEAPAPAGYTPPLIFGATISQVGTNDPMVNSEHVNTIGNIVWSRLSTGTYRGTLAGAFGTFSFPNTTVSFSSGSNTTGVNARVYRINPDIIEIKTTSTTDGSTPLDGALYGDLIITVYPQP